MTVIAGGQAGVNTISGMVMLADPPVGIPDLLVAVYDLDPATKPEEAIASAGATKGGVDLNALGDRIGSVLTGPGGRCSP